MAVLEEKELVNMIVELGKVKSIRDFRMDIIII